MGQEPLWELSRWLSGKESTFQCKSCKRCRFDPWVGKISWGRAWQPIPGFLPGESHGQRSLVGYSPWGCKESDMTESLSMHTGAPGTGERLFFLFFCLPFPSCSSDLSPVSLSLTEISLERNNPSKNYWSHVIPAFGQWFETKLDLGVNYVAQRYKK